MFIDDSKECYFNITDISLITMRLDDAIMESNENNETSDQFLLSQVEKIRQGIVQLLSISLLKKKIV